jgi:HAD superfamily hydrolase (TIGR01458 family)
VLLDIEGVLLTSSTAFPGAARTVEELRRRDLPVRFVTNTTSATSARIAATLVQAGIEVRAGELFTAAAVTAAYLQEHHPDARCLVLNDGANADLAGVRMADPDDASADVVVVGGGGPAFSWKQMNVALNCLMGGASLVAMHGAPVWRTGEGYCLDGGAYVRMLEECTGASAVVAGKPAPHMFLAAAESTGATPERLLMVGDDLDSDVLAAQAVGMVGVQVRTGKFRQQALDRSEEAPDHVIDSIADLLDLIDD